MGNAGSAAVSQDVQRWYVYELEDRVEDIVQVDVVQARYDPHPVPSPYLHLLPRVNLRADSFAEAEAESTPLHLTPFQPRRGGEDDVVADALRRLCANGVTADDAVVRTHLRLVDDHEHHLVQCWDAATTTPPPHRAWRTFLLTSDPRVPDPLDLSVRAFPSLSLVPCLPPLTSTSHAMLDGAAFRDLPLRSLVGNPGYWNPVSFFVEDDVRTLLRLQRHAAPAPPGVAFRPRWVRHSRRDAMDYLCNRHDQLPDVWRGDPELEPLARTVHANVRQCAQLVWMLHRLRRRVLHGLQRGDDPETVERAMADRKPPDPFLRQNWWCLAALVYGETRIRGAASRGDEDDGYEFYDYVVMQLAAEYNLVGVGPHSTMMQRAAEAAARLSGGGQPSAAAAVLPTTTAEAEAGVAAGPAAEWLLRGEPDAKRPRTEEEEGGDDDDGDPVVPDPLRRRASPSTGRRAPLSTPLTPDTLRLQHGRFRGMPLGEMRRLVSAVVGGRRRPPPLFVDPAVRALLVFPPPPAGSAGAGVLLPPPYHLRNEVHVRNAVQQLARGQRAHGPEAIWDRHRRWDVIRVFGSVPLRAQLLWVLHNATEAERDWFARGPTSLREVPVTERWMVSLVFGDTFGTDRPEAERLVRLERDAAAERLAPS